MNIIWKINQNYPKDHKMNASSIPSILFCAEPSSFISAKTKTKFLPAKNENKRALQIINLEVLQISLTNSHDS